MLNAKLFRCNTDIAEWCIARNKKEAYEFMDEFWDCGCIMEEHYLNPYLESYPNKTKEDFIEQFFIEENLTSDFTHPYYGDNDTPVTKKVEYWIKSVDSVPSYLCHESW